MRRFLLWGALLALLATAVGVSVARAQGPQLPEGIFATVAEQYKWDLAHPGARPGGTFDADAVEAQNIDGSYWANGPLDRVNGLASWNGVTISNFWARTADDFVIGVSTAAQNTPFTLCLQPLISEVRTTMIGNTNSPLELEIWSTATTGTGPTNVPSEATGGDVLNNKFSTVFTTLAPAFNFNVEEYVFTFSPALALPSGRFWINPLGNGYPNYFATSQGGRDGTATGPGFFRGAIFGFPSWVSATTQVAPPGQFAFDIDAACALPFSVRILGVTPGTVANANSNAGDEPQTLNDKLAAEMQSKLPIMDSAASPDQIGGRTRYCETGTATVEFTVGPAGTAFPNGPLNELTVTFPGTLRLISCTATGGVPTPSCAISGQIVTFNFGLNAGQTFVGTVNVQTVGGVQSNLSTSGSAVFGIPGIPTTPVLFNFNFVCTPSVDPNRQLGRQIHLPILNFQGQDEVCDTWIEVQNIGCDPAKAVLVTWADPGFCPPQAAGPLKVECTGLLRPGSTWNLLMAQIPTGSKSGMLFKFTSRQLSEVGIDLGFDDVVADLMCETLFFGIVGDADDYRRFKKAYNEGLEFAGIRQDIAAGAGYLAVDVLRKCPGDVTPTAKVTSLYNGIAGTHLGYYDPAFGGYGYYVPLLYADKGSMNSIMYIQNGGLECSSVEIWFKAQDDCLRAKICEVFTVAPGESFQFDATDCVGPDWQGSAWLRSSQPLGIAVDLVGRDVLMTYIAEPSEINYTFDPTRPLVSEGDQVAFGPLIYSEYQGWDTGIQVQNLSAVVNAKVKVYFLDRSGDIITTLVDWICPRGSQTFFLPVVHDLPGTWVGSVRVESQEWWTPGSPIVSPPNIVAVAQLIKYNDAARTQTQEAIAYNLLPEHKIYDWQIGYAGGGTTSGIGLVAIPSLIKDLDGPTGTTTEVAIANVVPKPGFTDFAIFIYDQNGLLDFVCQKLNEKQVEYIDLQTWGYVNPGFKGSAIISAVFWEHDVFDGLGGFVRNLVGLGAVAVHRTGTRLGEDVPGDEAAGDRGIPFGLSQLRDRQSTGNQDDARCQMSRGFGPACPGIDTGRRIPSCPLPALLAQSTDTPLLIPHAQTSRSNLTVATQQGCTIADLDVWITYDSTQLVDLSAVTLTHLGTTVTLWAPGICGASPGQIRAILDDEAPSAVSIGSAGTCIPNTFIRYRTNPFAAPGTPNTTNNLARFDGLDPNGLWFISSTDTLAPPNGGTHILEYWELQMAFN